MFISFNDDDSINIHKIIRYYKSNSGDRTFIKMVDGSEISTYLPYEKVQDIINYHFNKGE